MKMIRMKGKSVDDAVKAALEVLGGKEEDASVVVISEGKPAMLGVLGGEEAEVEVILKEGRAEDAKQILQEILDKMVFVAVVEGNIVEEIVKLDIKGDDMGRIIGKDGSTLKSLEIILASALRKIYGERVGISIDAGGYREKREKALERLARDAADEVAKTGEEKALPHMSAGDRRVIHLFLRDDPKVATFSKGEGRERRLIIVPR
jgi:spoIIIJ-associated protein